MTLDNHADVLILLTTSGNDLTLRRLEKGFFSSWSCKFTKIISFSTEAVIGFTELSKALKEKHFLNAFPNSTFVGCVSLSQVTVLELNNSVNSFTIRFTKVYPIPVHYAFASWSEAVVIKNEDSKQDVQNIVFTYSFGKHIHQLVITLNCAD